MKKSLLAIKKTIKASVRKLWCGGDIWSRFLFLQAAVCSTGSSLLSYQLHKRSIAVWNPFLSLCLSMCAWQSAFRRECLCVCVCARVLKRETEGGYQFERHSINRHTTQSCPRGSRRVGKRDGRKERWTDEWRERGGGGVAFVIRALTSVNLIKAVCVRQSERRCLSVCVCVCSPVWLPAGTALPLSMVCPSSDDPRLTN